MAVYNGEKYIREALDSVLNQTFADFELLIVNDNSTDGSLNVIKTFDDPRIRVIQNDRSPGLIGTRNLGLSNSTGEFIALLDCDDIAYKERLAKQVAFLDDNPEFGMIGAGMEIIDETGRPTGDVIKYTAPPEAIPSILLFNNYFAQSAVLIRKSALPKEHYRLYPGTEDYDMWVRIARNARVWNLQEILLKYRVHASSITFANAGNIKKYVGQIMCDQLKLINLNPSTRELDIHKSIGDPTFTPTGEFLAEAEHWMEKIYKANKLLKYYKSPFFERCLAEKWLAVCARAAGSGWAAWHLFRRSHLSELSKVSPILEGKLWLKCLLRWQNSRR